MSEQGWIGVDLDGTLAFDDGHKFSTHEKIGEPIPQMVARVKRWLAEGYTVKIFTARVAHHNEGMTPEVRAKAISRIQDWTEQVVGARLEVTHEKDMNLLEFWDDRAVQIETNTATLVGYSRRGLA